MKFDRVDALALHVESLQDRWIAVGQACILEDGGRAECLPGAYQIGRRCPGTFTLHGLLQRQVGGEQVVLGQRRRLIESREGGRCVFHANSILIRSRNGSKHGAGRLSARAPWTSWLALASNVQPVLNSQVMCASASHHLVIPGRRFPPLNSLALLLRR